MRPIFRVVTPLLCALLVGCATQSTVWVSSIGADHPMAGQLYAGTQPVSEQVLREATLRADFIVLGETHDNPDHHLLHIYPLLRGQLPQQLRLALAIDDGAFHFACDNVIYNIQLIGVDIIDIQYFLQMIREVGESTR